MFFWSIPAWKEKNYMARHILDDINLHDMAFLWPKNTVGVAKAYLYGSTYLLRREKVIYVGLRPKYFLRRYVDTWGNSNGIQTCSSWRFPASCKGGSEATGIIVAQASRSWMNRSIRGQCPVFTSSQTYVWAWVFFEEVKCQTCKLCTLAQLASCKACACIRKDDKVTYVI